MTYVIKIMYLFFHFIIRLSVAYIVTVSSKCHCLDSSSWYFQVKFIIFSSILVDILVRSPTQKIDDYQWSEVVNFYASIFISLRVGVSSSCEHGYENLASIRGGEFLE